MAMSLSVWAAGPVTAEKEEAGCFRKWEQLKKRRFLTEVWLVCYVVLMTTVQRSDSGICVYTILLCSLP